MQYKLRFFLQAPGKKLHTDTSFCFTTLNSEHAPQKDELVYIDDRDTDRSIVDAGLIYKVLRSVFCFDRASGCNSVEVVVKIDKSLNE